MSENPQSAIRNPQSGSDRYHRQTLLPQVGVDGQARLASSRVLLVGCGALGSVIAEQLVRAGVGFLRIVDRDVVEPTNLQRQVLFDEQDAREGIPKAIAAAARLARVNSLVTIHPVVSDVHAGNVEEIAELTQRGAESRAFSLILDGTDNVETRYLLNDVAVKHGIPWIYGACVGTEGRVMSIRPTSPDGAPTQAGLLSSVSSSSRSETLRHESACLRCIFPEPPGPGELPTCDTAGVLASAAGVVASLQVTAALKLLTGSFGPEDDVLITLDVWKNRFRAASIADARRDDCPTCGQRRFEFLDRPNGGSTVSLCGRNAVQVRSATRGTRLDLKQIANRLSAAGIVQRTPYLLRCDLREANVQLTLFPDGRAIIQGLRDPERARSLYARWIGS